MATPQKIRAPCLSKGKTCCVPWCNSGNIGKHFAHFRIPKTATANLLHKKWIENINTFLKISNKKSKLNINGGIVCERHFTPEDFVMCQHPPGFALKLDAIPSVFPWEKDWYRISVPSKYVSSNENCDIIGTPNFNRNLEGATQRTEIPQMAAERFSLSPLEIVPKENVQKKQTAQHHHISSRSNMSTIVGQTSAIPRVDDQATTVLPPVIIASNNDVRKKKADQNRPVYPIDFNINNTGNTKTIEVELLQAACPFKDCNYRGLNTIAVMHHIDVMHSLRFFSYIKPSRVVIAQLKAMGLYRGKDSSQKSKYSCQLCDFSSDGSKSLIEHEQKHEEKAKRQCHLCNFSAEKEWELYAHLDKDHVFGSYCDSCMFLPTSKSDWRKHLGVHQEEFRAREQRKTATISANLIKEKNIFEGENAVDPRQKESLFWDGNNNKMAAESFHQHFVGHEVLINNNANELPFKCSDCSYTASHRWAITEHIDMCNSADGTHKCASWMLTQGIPEHQYAGYLKMTSTHQTTSQLFPHAPVTTMQNPMEESVLSDIKQCPSSPASDSSEKTIPLEESDKSRKRHWSVGSLTPSDGSSVHQNAIIVDESSSALRSDVVLRNVDVVAEPQSKRIRRDSNSDPKHNNEAQLAESSHQIYKTETTSLILPTGKTSELDGIPSFTGLDMAFMKYRKEKQSVIETQQKVNELQGKIQQLMNELIVSEKVWPNLVDQKNSISKRLTKLSSHKMEVEVRLQMLGTGKFELPSGIIEENRKTEVQKIFADAEKNLNDVNTDISSLTELHDIINGQIIEIDKKRTTVAHLKSVVAQAETQLRNFNLDLQRWFPYIGEMINDERKRLMEYASAREKDLKTLYFNAVERNRQAELKWLNALNSYDQSIKANEVKL